MGVFEQLADLDKTASLAAPEPAKLAAPPPAQERHTPPPHKAPTAPRRVHRASQPAPVVVDNLPHKQRVITRNSFEIYQDQIAVLRQVSLSAKLAGDKLSMSEMVREALDSYLTDKNLKL